MNDGIRPRRRQGVILMGFIFPVSVKYQRKIAWNYTNLSGIESHTYTLLTTEEDKFMPNMTSDDDRMAIRKNWDMLMPCKFSVL